MHNKYERSLLKDKVKSIKTRNKRALLVLCVRDAMFLSAVLGYVTFSLYLCLVCRSKSPPSTAVSVYCIQKLFYRSVCVCVCVAFVNMNYSKSERTVKY